MKTLLKKIFFNSRSDFAKSRSAIYSVSSKAVMIKQCNAITTNYMGVPPEVQPMFVSST